MAMQERDRNSKSHEVKGQKVKKKRTKPTQNVSYFLAYSASFPLRFAKGFHSSQHPGRATPQQRQHPTKRALAAVRASGTAAAETRMEIVSTQLHGHGEANEHTEIRRTGAAAAEAHTKRTETWPETSLFSCSWIVKGPGRVLCSVRKVAQGTHSQSVSQSYRVKAQQFQQK